MPPPHIKIGIVSIGLRELVLKELFDPSTAKTRASGGLIPRVQMSLASSLDFPERSIATLTLAVSVKDAAPDPLAEVTLKVTGIFKYEEGVSRREVGSYLSRMGGGILFPYVREVVHSVSARTLYQPMLLQPTVVSPLFSEEQIASIEEVPPSSEERSVPGAR